MCAQPHVSIVLPVYNEEGNILELLGEIETVMNGLDIGHEVVCVDDGSSDRSLELIRGAAASMKRVRYLAFAENRGQSAAFTAGFDAARAPIIITMDSDRQNDPADIPRMLAEFEKGADMVIGWRADRRDTWVRKAVSRVGNSIRNTITSESVHDTGCSLKVMRAEMARRMPRFTGMHRYMTTLMRNQGARISEIKVNHRERTAGVSKYGTLDRALVGIMDLVGVRWLKSRAFTYSIKETD